jgi:hypothetical protein
MEDGGDSQMGGTVTQEAGDGETEGDGRNKPGFS